MTEKWTRDDWKKYQADIKRGKESKFGAIKGQSADGTKHKSLHEGKYYRRMLLLKQVGDVVKIETEVRYEFIVNEVFVGTYYLDFRITYADGHIEYIDTKSTATLTNLFRIKKQLMLACHGIEVVPVFDDALK